MVPKAHIDLHLQAKFFILLVAGDFEGLIEHSRHSERKVFLNGWGLVDEKTVEAPFSFPQFDLLSLTVFETDLANQLVLSVVDIAS